jgi:hypothetical protein
VASVGRSREMMMWSKPNASAIALEIESCAARPVTVQ